jgi:hypothetical protein
MDSKEEVLQHRDDTILQLTQETNNLQNEMTVFRNQFADLL